MKMKDREKTSATPARLREDSIHARDASAEWAVSILRTACRYAPPPGRQQRIWANLGAGISRVGDAAQSPRRSRFAFAMAACVLALCLAGAALAHRQGWWGRQQTNTRDRSGPPRFGAMRADQAPVATRSDSASSLAEPEPAKVSPARAEPVATGAPSEVHRFGAGRTALAPDGSELLLKAMRALRIERDSARARTLLVTYLARHPKADLSEEALVMLVEAAAAHGDGDAALLADQYSTLYPGGQFANQVRRALEGKGPAR
jgi:hypothetical protein